MIHKQRIVITRRLNVRFHELLTQEKQDQNRHQNVKVIDELIFDAFQKTRFEQFPPCFVRNKRNQKD